MPAENPRPRPEDAAEEHQRFLAWEEEMLAAVAALEAHGTTVVLSTHDVDLAWRWADEVALVVDHVVHQGEVTDALTDGALVEAARLRPPWSVQLLREMGIEPAAAGWPRTPADVAVALASSHSSQDSRVTR